MMKADAEALYNGFPLPRRYNFEEHEALSQQIGAEPVVSPEEFERAAGDLSIR